MSKKFKLHDSYAKKIEDEKKQRRFSTVKKGWGNGFVDHAVLNRKMFHPYFLGAWIGILFFKFLVIVLPYQVQMFIGRCLGRALGAISPSRKYILKCNLKLAFPMMSDEERRIMAHKVMENTGMAIFETGMAWFWSDRRLLKRCYIDEEELRKARELAKTGKPILALTAHFLTLEITARLYATFITPGVGIYRPSEHPVWEYTQVKGRLRKNIALIDHKDPKSMIKSLMRGIPVWYPPDQDYGRKASVFVPFFGVDKAATVVGTHNLAKVKGTRVQPIWTIRENGRYRLYVGAPLENFPTDDVVADTRRCNEIIEDMIRMAPEQYLWLHRRYKTVPEGMNPEERYPKIIR